MQDFTYKVAEDLDASWLNFELDLPLRGSNPFYVSRPYSPANELARTLSAPFVTPPKRFLSGYRGCGKTTELIRLAESDIIQDKYWPIYFSIRGEVDVSDLDFQDILLAIASRMYRDYRSSGAKLPSQLVRDLDSWRGEVETEVTSIVKGRIADTEVEAGLDAFFANAGLKMKLEPKTRKVIRHRTSGKLASNYTTQFSPGPFGSF